MTRLQLQLLTFQLLSYMYLTLMILTRQRLCPELKWRARLQLQRLIFQLLIYAYATRNSLQTHHLFLNANHPIHTPKSLNSFFQATIRGVV